MIKVVTLCKCDACKKEVPIDICPDEDEPKLPGGWIKETEIGDLCPSCAEAWKNYKKSFIEKMRMDKKEDIIS